MSLERFCEDVKPTEPKPSQQEPLSPMSEQKPQGEKTFYCKQWLFLILTGIAAAGGQIFITKAYSKAPAKEISVYDFSIVLFAALFGFMFLRQVPDILSFVGYIIIIGIAVIRYRVTLGKK